jgi:hypothetical protein
LRHRERRRLVVDPRQQTAKRFPESLPEEPDRHGDQTGRDVEALGGPVQDPVLPLSGAE